MFPRELELELAYFCFARSTAFGSEGITWDGWMGDCTKVGEISILEN